MKRKQYYNTMKYGLFFLALLFIFVLLSTVYNHRRTRTDTQAESNVTTIQTDKATIFKLKDNGGRVSWYKGDGHNLIAYDAIVSKLNRNTEVYTFDPATQKTLCVTCTSNIPKGFTGQAEWHPDGEYLILQAENENSDHGVFNHSAWGVNNDLWIIKKDGTEAKKIYDTPSGNAVLHPHFNDTGTKLIFAERVPTGKQIPGGKLAGTPGGENQWDGWQIHIADVDLNSSETLSQHTSLFQNSTGVYETHGFHNDQIIFTHTPLGRAYMDDIYMSDINGRNIIKLTDNPDTWDEHGHFSPADETLMAYMSSAPFENWNGRKGDKAQTLRTELFIKNVVTNKAEQITNLNEKLDKEVVISDFDWNKDGTQIVLQVAEIKGGAVPELWLLTFNE